MAMVEDQIFRRYENVDLTLSSSTGLNFFQENAIITFCLLKEVFDFYHS